MQALELQYEQLETVRKTLRECLARPANSATHTPEGAAAWEQLQETQRQLIKQDLRLRQQVQQQLQDLQQLLLQKQQKQSKKKLNQQRWRQPGTQTRTPAAAAAAAAAAVSAAAASAAAAAAAAAAGGGGGGSDSESGSSSSRTAAAVCMQRSGCSWKTCRSWSSGQCLRPCSGSARPDECQLPGQLHWGALRHARNHQGVCADQILDQFSGFFETGTGCWS
jgi:hypothetical protein